METNPLDELFIDGTVEFELSKNGKSGQILKATSNKRAGTVTIRRDKDVFVIKEIRKEVNKK